MNSDHSPSRATGAPGVGIEAAGNASRYLARERQKDELRDERDRLLLDLARDIGPQGLAQRLGAAPAVIDKLLGDARSRVERKVAASLGSEITARRLATRADRWADADAHYAALGCGPPRALPPQRG